MPITMTVSPFFVGGACMLDFRSPPVSGLAPAGTYTITRTPIIDNVLGIPVTIAYDAPIDPLWLDLGDGMDSQGNTITGPIPPGTYQYDVTATIGGIVSTATSIISLAQSISIIPDGMNDVLIRCVKGAVLSVNLPLGFTAPEVINAMPIADFPPLPFVAINEELIQQTDVPIGQNVEVPDQSNNWTITTYGKRMWRISVIARNSQERDFWRDYLIAVFNTLAKDLFAPLGRNIRHRFQAATYNIAKDEDVPGFYGSDVLFEFEGNMNTTLTTNYGTIQTITGATTVMMFDGPNSVTDYYQVPPTE